MKSKAKAIGLLRMLGIVTLLGTIPFLQQSVSSQGPSDMGTKTPSSIRSSPASSPWPRGEHLIFLKAKTIDTSKILSLDQADIQVGLEQMGISQSTPAYYLVQFKGPARDDWKAKVESVGGKLFGFVPNYAFVVKMNDAIAEEVAALPEVQWVGLYHPSFKFVPELVSKHEKASEPASHKILPSGQEIALDEREESQELLDGEPIKGEETANLMTLTVMTFEGEQAGPVSAAIRKLGGIILGQKAGENWGLIRVRIEPSFIPQIASMVEVQWIEEYIPPQLFNDVARDIMNVDPVQSTHGLTGAGQIIGHADTGLDVGVNDSSLHDDFEGRVLAAHAWGWRVIDQFSAPEWMRGLTWDGANLWHAGGTTIYKLDTTGSVLASFPSPGPDPAGLTWDGTYLWNADLSDEAIYKLDTSGTVVDSFPSPGPLPSGLTWDGTHLWLCDYNTDTIYKLDTAGNVVSSFPSPDVAPQGLAWDGTYLWNSDWVADTIYKLDTSGNVIDSFPSPGPVPTDLTWDGTYLWNAGFSDEETYKLGTGAAGDWSDPDGHGTHTAGSILGNGTAYMGNGSPGAGQYRGAAYEAQLVHQSIMEVGGGLGGLPEDLGNLFTQAYDDGARIHSNSWGASVFGDYTSDSAEVDHFMWNHKDMLVVFSAGNDGVDADADGVVDPDSIGSPRTAKNVLTVGASENDRPSIPDTWGSWWPSDFPMNPIRNDKVADNTSGMAAFSSRGPTDDWRVKPDLVAPGTFVASARSQLTVISFDDDVEGGTAGWTADAPWDLTTSSSHSPTHGWTDSPGGDYADNVSLSLTHDTLDLGGGGGEFLAFWTRYDFGCGDKGRLEVSGNGGLSWPGYVQFTGTQDTWTHKVVDLGGFANQEEFRFRFRIISDDDGNVGDGWYIDDVRIYSGSLGDGLLSDYDLADKGSPENDAYILDSGTSMSAPLTAGAAALVRQFYTDNEGSTPSAALIKATLINGASDMTPGQYGGEPSGSPIFSDDMESGAGNWIADSPWDLTTSTSHSPTHSWTDSPGENYTNDINVSLTSAGIFDLTTIPNPGLVFWHRYDVESHFDFGHVEVSTDGGTSWETLASFTGVNSNWTRAQVNLLNYAAENAIKIRFRLETDFSVTRDGWYIDDVSIEPISVQEITARPDNAQGWGRVNLENTLFPSPPRTFHYFDVTDGLSTGESNTYNFSVDSSTPLKVTLAWTDYPGEPFAVRAEVNDLDLEVVGPDDTHYAGNQGLYAADHWCLRDDKWDSCNNVEGIDILSPSLGSYTVTVSAAEVPQGPQPYALVISEDKEMCDLDKDASAWGVYPEGSPVCRNPENVPTPSIDGNALRSGIEGGSSYSNCHYYRNLLPEPNVEGLTLAMSLWFTPTTTFNNEGGPSVIQALEFTMNKWHQSKRYEFALQWMNVGDGGPQWRYWDPHRQPETERWVELGISDELEGEQWHNLKLEGDIVNDQVHYRRFCIDQQCHSLDITVPPAIYPGWPDSLAVAFQLDGNHAEDDYDVFVDKLCFVRGPCFLSGDLDGSGQVDVSDTTKVASSWRTSLHNPDPDNDPDTPSYYPLYDVDDDFDVDVVDVMWVAAQWGESCQ